MPYVNSDATLADAIGPAYLAQQTGIQNDAANQEQAIKNQVAQGTAAADIAKPGLANLYQQAQTQDVGARTQAQDLANAQTSAMLPSNIQSGIAGNELKTQQDQSGKLMQLGQIAGQVASYLDNVPPPARAAAMQQLLQQNGIDPQRLGALAQGDPDMLRQFSQKTIQAAPTWQQNAFNKESDYKRDTDVANIQGATSRDVANTQQEGKLEAAKIQAETKRQLANLDQTSAVLYQKVANGTATPAERQALDSINQSRQLIRSGMPFQAGLTNQPVQSNVPPVPNTTPQQGPDLGNPGPFSGGGGGGAAQTAALRAEMIKRGLLK